MKKRKFSTERLLEVLGDERLSLPGVRKLVGISSTGFKKLQNGSIPSANTLVALADVLEKPLDYFFVEDCNYSFKKEAS